MINFKSSIWISGVIVASVLSGCQMDRPYEPQSGYRPQSGHAPQPPVTINKGVPQQGAAGQAKAVHRKASVEPLQQRAPGPKQAAAPALPVIQ